MRLEMANSVSLGHFLTKIAKLFTFFFKLLVSFRLRSAFRVSSSPPSSFNEIIYYIHGWQRHASCPELFHVASNHKGEPIPLQYALEGMGKAYKPLYWHKWAFDSEVAQVQHRVWTAGPIEELTLDYYEHKLETGLSVPSRIIGHSLGAQVALKLAHNIVNLYPRNPELWPKRIALLEPAFIRGSVTPGVYNVRQSCIELITELQQKYNVTFECYRSSFLSRNPVIALTSDPLKSLMVSVDLYPNHLPWFDISARHCEVKNFYFSSFINPPRTLFLSQAQHASTSMDDTIKNKEFHFSQVTSLDGHPIFQRNKKN